MGHRPAESKKFFYGGICLLIAELGLVLLRVLVALIPDGVPEIVSDLIFSGVLNLGVMCAVPLLLFLYVERPAGASVKTFAAEIGLGKPDRAGIIAAVVLGIPFYVMTLGISAIFILIFLLFGYFPSSVPPIDPGVGAFLLAILLTAVLPGIFEEILYRGVIRRALNVFKSDTGVILFTALCFGLGHQYIRQTGYTFVGGLVFAYLAVKTRSIWPSVIVHFINNGLSVYLEAAEVNGWPGGQIFNSVENLFAFIGIGILATGVVVFILYFLTAYYKNKEREKAEPTYIRQYDPVTGAQKPDLLVYGAPRARSREYRASAFEKTVWTAAVILAALNTAATFFWAVI